MLWCHCKYTVMFRHLATTSWAEFFPGYKVEFMMKPSHCKSNNMQSFGDYLLVFSKEIQTNSVYLCQWYWHTECTEASHPLLSCSVSFSSISKTTNSNELVLQLSLMLAPRGLSTEDIISMCSKVFFLAVVITHLHY